MKHLALIPLLLAAAPAPMPAQKPAPSPPEIVAAAPASDWVAIAASDLLVMDLASPAQGPGQASPRGPRRVVIQLMPAPFSQGWVGNIRKLAAARFWDGTSVNRVQDNYVVQWGDASEKKALPGGLVTVEESEYVAPYDGFMAGSGKLYDASTDQTPEEAVEEFIEAARAVKPAGDAQTNSAPSSDPKDSYSMFTGGVRGWSLGSDGENVWPTHCYGMVGVGRGLPPDTGTGAELYTVIGHAPRHLDRNIALVGRVIEGMEHLSSLPRGRGPLGFYEKAEERVPILSVRIASEMESDKPLPTYEYLSTESASFAAYADARANRRDPFFIKPAGGADICNIPVPVRRVR